MKKGFTLAEVLLTLLIIGVVAAITIPIFMYKTNKQEFRSSLKKSISSVNQALIMEYATSGTSVYNCATAQEVYDKIFKHQFDIIKSTAGDGFAKTASIVFYTNDGIMIGIKDGRYGGCNVAGTSPCFDILIDVNGDRFPNKATTSATDPMDGYYATLYAQKLVPYGDVTQKVIYDEGIYTN